MTNFWDNHGIFFLIFITMFPRLTLIFSSVAFGGFFWWVGFIMVPRTLVAVLATMSYWESNPVLVIISWFIAIFGESLEKSTIRKKVKVSHHRPPAPPTFKSGDVIDADFTRIK
jgi:hypothetical protein